jgi:hypothetical protein
VDLEETNNKRKIWNYMQTAGIKVAILYQFSANKTESDTFNITFDNILNDIDILKRYIETIKVKDEKSGKLGFL